MIIIDNEIKSVTAKLLAEKIVNNAIKKYHNKIYFVINKELSREEWINTAVNNSKAFFIIYHGKEGNYRIESIPQKLGLYSYRKLLPLEWRGKSQSELAKLTNINDFVFCHKAGFVGSAKTLKSAIKIAEISVNG